jgi:carbamate kinase
LLPRGVLRLVASVPEGAPRTALVAIGGNALVRADDPSVRAQREQVARTCARLAAMAAQGWRIVITHGNGPQVGAALLRSERAAPEAYPLPLDVCVASTQGEMGFLLQQALSHEMEANRLSNRVVTLVTQVLVSEGDEAFQAPTKPIGPFYSRDEAEERRRSGWVMAEQSRGWRRVVPSPEPLAILEEEAVRTLLGSDATVITLGGGGVPVARHADGLAGVEAVVDKDLSSALLATALRVDLFLIVTDVDGVYTDFGTSRARRLRTVTADELRTHAAAGHFAPGSMGPKAEAVLRFIEAGGAHAIVTLPEHLELALAGSEGTHAFGARG